jgi:hypothetical protein
MARENLTRPTGKSAVSRVPVNGGAPAGGDEVGLAAGARTPRFEYEPGFSPWLARRLLAHGERYFRKKKHLQRCVAEYRETPSDGRKRRLEEATAELRVGEAKLERSLWRLRQETAHGNRPASQQKEGT